MAAFSHRSLAYDVHLAAVSRSFAVCIRELPTPARSWVSLSYLLCRLLDTVEDSPWAAAPAQIRSFLAFDTFVRRPPAPQAVAAWAAALPQPLPPGEAALVADAGHLLADLHALPARVRHAVQRTLWQMSRGMRQFLATRAEGVSLRLAGPQAVNRYCFVVAGVVGLLLLELFALADRRVRRAPGRVHDAVHFGLLLQKINLLKDQADDERVGRFLVPDRRTLLATLERHARYAGRFVLRLPASAVGMRRFCAWSLFLAAHSVSAIEAQAGGKLPRAVTAELFAEVGALCASNGRLKRALAEAHALLARYEAPAPASPFGSAARTPHATPAMLPWLLAMPGGLACRPVAHALS